MATQGKQGPVQHAKTPAPDQVSSIRHPQGGGYGTNTPQSSSIAPGQAAQSSLATNLRSSVDDSVLDSVIAHGTAKGGVDNTQLRNVSTANVPPAYGQKGASAGGTVPAKLGTTNEPPVRKP